MRSDMDHVPTETDPAPPSRDRGAERAAETERARTPRTPILAFAGVWTVLAVVVALVVVLTFVVYLASS